MKNIKRIIGLMLIFVLCLEVFNCSVAFAKQDDISGELEEAMEVLRLFEIIPDYYDYNTPFNKEVSRAEFADAVVRLIDMKEYKGSEVYFYDVPKTHFAYNSISLLTEMGILNGTESHIFSPDVPIEDAAAYKIILSIIGYGDFADYNGGYPNGYITAARKAEIDIPSSTSNLTHDEMFRVLYKALRANMLEIISWSNGGEYTVSNSSENCTIFSVYYNIYEGEGVVTGADCISFDNIGLTEKEKVLIDNQKYESEIDLSEYLGEEIKYLYSENSKNDKKIVWAKRTDKTDVLYINVDDDAGFNENTFVYTYARGNKNADITIDRGVVLVYNGNVVDDDYGKILNSSRYDAKFIKNDGKYSIIIVNSYENYIADSVALTSFAVYDKFKPKEKVNLKKNDYDYLSIKRRDGEEITVSDIKTDDVLSVFMSKDKKRIEVIVASTVKSGIVKSIKISNGKKMISFENGEYYVSKDAYCEDFSTGDSVKLYMDYKGLVAAVIRENESEFAAYVAGMAMFDEDFEEKLKLKILKQDGSVAIYECGDKVTIDGKSKCTPADVENALSQDGEFVPQLILVEINSKGIIREIETSAENYNGAENILNPNLEYQERQYKIQGFFNFEAAIDENTIIFGVPKDEIIKNAEEKDFRIIKKSELKDDSKHFVMSYNAKERYGYEQYVVIKEDEKLAYGQDLPILVTNKGYMINADGDIAEYIEGYEGKVMKSVPSDGKLVFDDIQPGMLVRIQYTRDGEAASREILYDPQNAEEYYTTTAPFNNIYGVEVGFVNDIMGDVIKIGYGSGANVNHVSNLYNSPAILVYDKNNDKLNAYPGSFADARRYYNVGDDCSQVVLITKHCTPLLYVFYN